MSKVTLTVMTEYEKALISLKLVTEVMPLLNEKFPKADSEEQKLRNKLILLARKVAIQVAPEIFEDQK